MKPPYYKILRICGPSNDHTTAAQAVTEAERLAAQHPGDTFEVLQCLAVTRTSTPVTEWLDGCGPEESEPWTFDWSVVQEGYDYAAMDEDDTWYAYQFEPFISDEHGNWDVREGYAHQFDHPPFPGDWKDSLQTRPAKAPTPTPPEPGYIEITDPEEIIPEEYLPLPPLPEGKTQWVGRGDFPARSTSVGDRTVMHYSTYQREWLQSRYFSTEYFHIEAV